ncbi:MAG: polyprenyl synthetase family protein [Clostridia bacterium]|nr:polyprenyl synthetase family protein [Clostridia bacterium]
MSGFTEKVEKELLSYLPESDNENIKKLIESMQYSLMAGGKRVRPMLVLEFAKLCGGSEEAAMPFACALEMVHTYSLIHDDLPCMDNDDLRRGKPTNHKVYGEATALLAGSGLLTLAFETVLSEKSVRLNGAEKCAAAARALAQYAGADGMLGGQMIDLESEGKTVTVEHLKVMDNKKTGALMAAACSLGCISAGAAKEQLAAAVSYAENIGLAFQIIDDILDITSTTEELGKPVGSDDENKKSTYAALLGLDRCRELSRELTEKAAAALDVFENDTSVLKNFAYYLLERQN